MKNHSIAIFLAAYLLLLAARAGFSGVPAAPPAEGAASPRQSGEAVYQLNPLREQQTFYAKSGGRRELAEYDYQLLTLSVSNPEDLSSKAAERAERNLEVFNAKMEALLAEYTTFGLSVGQDAEKADAEGFFIEAYYDNVAAAGSIVGEVVSVRIDRSSYTGGAHPNRYTASYLFDLRTGQFIDPTQLADDPAVFQTGAAEKLLEKADAISENRDGYWPDYKEIISRWSESAVLFDKEGMLVVFSTYELGPYAMGEVELRLSFDELAELMGPGGLERLGVESVAVVSG